MKTNIITLFMLMLMMTALLISCSNTPETTNKPTDEIKEETPIYKVNFDEVSSVSIYISEKTGELTEKEDIEIFLNVINTASNQVGAVTDDLYREVKINMKDGSVQSLLFGSKGSYFLAEETHYTYRPSTNIDVLRELIDRAEKEYAER